MPVAELRGVTKRYGQVEALRGIDLSIEPGKLVALLGPNGAGKTTAVRILLGLTSPTSGEATLFGHRSGQPPGETPPRRAAAGGQSAGNAHSPRAYRAFFELLREASAHRRHHRRRRPRAIQNRLFGALSGGQRQRVLFALAICGNPDLLFLDEPTVGLDVESRRALWARIREFVGRGGSVLLTTHYLEEADALAHRVAVIDRGRIAAEGTPAEIKARTRTSGLEDAFLAIMRENGNAPEEVLQ